ncbi:unnamed protein product [Pedinophyceae sp. YPF-701]|nr:unnamed protein product [Pedinophyceae sp. YPF-701]
MSARAQEVANAGPGFVELTTAEGPGLPSKQAANLADLLEFSVDVWTPIGVRWWAEGDEKEGGLALPSVGRKLEACCIDGALLETLTDSSLKTSIGIQDPGHRDAILRGVAALLERQNKLRRAAEAQQHEEHTARATTTPPGSRKPEPPEQRPAAPSSLSGSTEPRQEPAPGDSTQPQRLWARQGGDASARRGFQWDLIVGPSGEVCSGLRDAVKAHGVPYSAQERSKWAKDLELARALDGVTRQALQVLELKQRAEAAMRDARAVSQAGGLKWRSDQKRADAKYSPVVADAVRAVAAEDREREDAVGLAAERKGRCSALIEGGYGGRRRDTKAVALFRANVLSRAQELIRASPASLPRPQWDTAHARPSGALTRLQASAVHAEKWASGAKAPDGMGLGLTAIDGRGNTPLHLACVNQDTDALGRMLRLLRRIDERTRVQLMAGPPPPRQFPPGDGVAGMAVQTGPQRPARKVHATTRGQALARELLSSRELRAAVAQRTVAEGAPAAGPVEEARWRAARDALAELANADDIDVVNARNAAGETPLHVAIGASGPGSARWVQTAAELLLWAGADANAQDATGRTPLTRLCASSYVNGALVSVLLRWGALARLADGVGKTPLHYAAANAAAGAPGAARALLQEGGAYVDARGGRFGRTPLHLAARGYRTQVLRVLLGTGGAMPAPLDARGHSPARACIAAYREAADRAWSHPVKSINPSYDAEEDLAARAKQCWTILAELLRYGARASEDGLLAEATASGSKALIKPLLDAIAAEERWRTGGTPPVLDAQHRPRVSAFQPSNPVVASGTTTPHSTPSTATPPQRAALSGVDAVRDPAEDVGAEEDGLPPVADLSFELSEGPSERDRYPPGRVLPKPPPGPPPSEALQAAIERERERQATVATPPKEAIQAARDAVSPDADLQSAKLDQEVSGFEFHTPPASSEEVDEFAGSSVASGAPASVGGRFESPLHVAARRFVVQPKRFAGALRMLVEAGADVGARNEEGRTPGEVMRDLGFGSHAIALRLLEPPPLKKGLL